MFAGLLAPSELPFVICRRTMASSGTQLGGFGNGTAGAGGITGFPIGGGFQAPGQAQGQGQPGDRTAWIQSQPQMPVGP